MANTNKDKNQFGNQGQSQFGSSTGTGSNLESMKEEAKGTATGVMESAKGMASNAAKKAGDAAGYVGEKAEDAAHSMGSGMKSLAGTVRQYSPREGMLGNAGAAVAEGLESSGRYLEEYGLSGIGEDLTGMIRRNPVPAVLIGIGLGFLIARATRS